MAKTTRAVAILALLTVVALGCSQPSLRAKSDMHEGKRALDDGEFAVAQELFMRSAKAQPSAAAYAFAATAAYNVNDLTNAAAFVEKAGAFKGGSNVYLRVLAYKALNILPAGQICRGGGRSQSLPGRRQVILSDTQCRHCAPHDVDKPHRPYLPPGAPRIRHKAL